MARGPRKTLEEQIQSLDVLIEKAKSRLDDLLEQREGLEQQRREEEVGRLYDLMVESGKTLEELEQYIIGGNGEENIA